MKTIRVGLIQMDSQDQKEKNMRKASELLEEAVSRGATLVGFPEYFDFIVEENQELEQAETIPGPTTTQTVEWVRKHQIWLHGRIEDPLHIAGPKMRRHFLKPID